MFLSRVAIEGFKSFADRSVLELGPGITALVGPNGAGKSNLVDAIRWALGEQNPRFLRATRMEDLLFAGAGGRRPAPMAEVTLTLCGLADALDPGGVEASVTRRLYRSGESEYRLNGAPCRLRDVQASMEAAGLGLDGAWHVEQGRIEAFMESPSPERRRWVEEAIGLGRYRLERAATIRELATMDQDLRQLGVLIGELEDRLPALELAAQRADRARKLAKEIRDLEVAVAGARLATMRGARADAERERQAARSAVEASHRLQGWIAQATRQETAAHEDLRASLARWEERVARAQASHEGLRQRILERERLTRAAQEIMAHQRTRRSELLAALRVARRRLDPGEGRGLETHWRTAQEALLAAEARWGASAEALQARQRLQVERSALQLEAERIAAELAALPQAAAVPGAAAEAQARLEAAQAQLAAETERAELARRRVDTQAARLEAQGRTGPPERAATAMILRAGHAGRLEGIVGRVGALVRVRRPEHEEAVAQALGAAVDHVVVRSEAHARAAIQWLRQAQAGRTTLLPLDILRAAPALRPPSVPGLVGVAVQLVDVEPGMEPVALVLLGRVLVAVDLAAAVAIGRATDMRTRVVTLEGDVLHPGGAMTGGGGGDRGARLRPLRDALAQARVQLEAALSHQRTVQAQVADLQGELQACQVAAARAEREAQLEAAQAAVTERLHELGPQVEVSLPLEEVAEVRSRERAARDAFEAWRTAAEHTRQVAREVLGERRLLQRSISQARAQTARVELADLDAAAAVLDQARRGRDQARRLATLVQAMALSLERTRVGAREAEHREAERAARLEGRVVELGAALADAWQRMADELGVDPEAPPQAVGPGDEARLARLKKSLAALGATSPFAEVEHAQVRRRHEAARTQEGDLLGAKDALVRALAEADRQAHERFLAAVDRLDQAFGQAFQALFGGGTARVWADESGMEARVQPPGKRTRVMSLLSGGERSLTGMALLFALIEVFGSPFHLLDEVEAPLDEANVERVARYLRDHREHQWVLITHQRATMERADVLYGVTMAEPGVSRLYTLRLESEVRHAGVE